MSFLSGLGKIFGTVVTDVAPALSKIGTLIHPATTAAGKAATVGLDAATAAGKAVASAAARHPVIAAAGAASVAAAGIAGSKMGGKAPAGMHPAVARSLGLKRHRRMHPGNTKALHRSLRRVKSFERLARRVMSITHHRPVKMHFKFRRHRKAA